MLRILLPSVRKFLEFAWASALEACFRGNCAPYLTDLDIWLGDNEDGAVFSWNVLEAVPSLEKISIDSINPTLLGGAACQSISAALRHGVLQNLQKLGFSGILGYKNFIELLDALGGSDCSQRITRLSFDYCEVGGEGMSAVAGLLCRDAFPALKGLYLFPKSRHHRRFPRPRLC